MARTKSKKQPTNREDLDKFVGPLTGRGEVPVAILIRDVMEIPQPRADRVIAGVELFKLDPRFVLTDNGLESTVRLAGEPEEIVVGREHEFVTKTLPFTEAATEDLPGEIVVEGAPIKFIAVLDGSTPPPTGEAAPVPTIGEALEQQQAEAAAADSAPDIDSTHEVIDQVEFQRIEDADRARRDKEENEKRLASGIEALDNAIANITADLKEKKDRRKVLQSELMASILGHTQTSLPESEGLAGDEIDVDETPIAKAHRGEVPPIVEPNGLGLIRGMGATSATQGKIETDCPWSREENAKERSMWLDGFRETMREDKSERPAEKQGLFRDALVEAMITNSLGLLEPGADTPKVRSVKFDERPHLVVGMCSADENPGAIERWSLVPLFTRDEWAETFLEEFGPAIRSVDASDEAKANRQKRGVDTGRMVKCGRSVMVVGPLSRLTVATVVPTEQPSH